MRLKITVVLVALLALGSCGTGSGTKVALKWWQFWTSPDVKPTVLRFANGYQQEHHDVSITLGDLTWADGHEKIAIALAAGNGPDVIELGSDWVAEFAASGKLADLTPGIGGLRDSLKLWDPVEIKGKYYGVPWMLGTRVMFCNRALLKQAGYDEHYVPQTWDQLLEASDKIHKLGPEIFGFASNSAERHRLYKKYLPFFWSAGGEVFNGDQTATQFNSLAGIKSLEYYLKLSETGIIETQSRLEDYFAAGKIGFVISGEWFVKRLAKGSPVIDYFVISMPPAEAGGTGYSFAGGEYLVVNQGSKCRTESIELLRYLTQPENDTAFARATGSFTPVNKYSHAIYDSSLAAIAQVFQLQLEHSKTTPVHPQWVAIEEILEHGIEQALYHKTTAAEALASIDRDCAEVLKKNAAQ